MYFNCQRKINICNLINEKYLIYAHKKYMKNEKLEEHSNLSVEYFIKIVHEKHLYKVFEKLEIEFLKDVSVEGRKLFKEMVLNTVVLHDIGKVNPFFQKNRLDNDLRIDESEKYHYSNHSMLSSIIYIDIYLPKVNRLKSGEKTLLLDFMMMSAYVISKHHGNLSSWNKFKGKFDLDDEGEKLLNERKNLYKKTLNREITINIKIIKNIFKIIKDRCNYTKEQTVYRYIYERLMLSVLIACDFYSTSEFVEDVKIDDIGIINDIDKFYDIYKNGDIYKLIREYENIEYGKDFTNIKDINILRNELFLEAEKTCCKNIESNIFYLEAPTGSGKSNVATNLSFKILQKDKTKNKIFYVYPFNTLVEQNISTLEEVFKKEENIFNKIAVINSIEPIKTDKEVVESEDTNIEYYKKALLNNQFLNYPIVLTTHVTIFKYLFGTSKEDLFPLHQIANSVIVLDEIQSYKNLIWGEIITFLSCYSRLLNIKVIIMSATLPDLDKLSLSKVDTVRLIRDREKYFGNPLFKNRVKVDYHLLKSPNIIDDLYNHVKNQSYRNKKILIEFISKDSAYKFYNRLKADNEILCDVELMTGDDNIGERHRIIKKVKLLNSIILVATQVVEAGVDIDMDIGYKNISMFDSEEQFLGRINRSCKKDESIVCFFKIDEAKNIYRNDVRLNKDLILENNNIRKILIEKKFGYFYDLVIARLKNITGGLNELNIENFFYTDVRQLEFKKIETRLRLIDDRESKISVYLSSNIELRGEKLNGEEIWKEYKKLLSDHKMDYSEKRVKLSGIKSKMNNFIYDIKWNADFPYNDRIGDLYFIENGDSYFKEGKLDKEKFITGIGEFL